jgi:folate-binding protein YgfZ
MCPRFAKANRHAAIIRLAESPHDAQISLAMTRIAALPERAAIRIAGEDRVPFLQGLVSNDVAEAAPGRAVWSALLTPQGKWLADFFILSDGNRLLLDAERGQVPMLLQRLSRFRLRSKVTIAEATELSIHAAWDGAPRTDAIAAPDPRLPEAGWRILSPTPLPTNATDADWDRHRLALGLPDGSRDLESDKTVLLEAGFDELNGVSWTKGCYMGQELTARTKYRGLVKRRLAPVAIDGPPPSPGTPVFRDTAEIGTMRSGRDRLGLALLRLDMLHASLTCGDARLTPRVPAWMHLPEKADAS